MTTGFHIDIYTLSNVRNKEIIEEFLSEYTDRKSIENTKDSELSILENDEYAFVKTENLTESINLGLSKLTTCFTLYFPSRKSIVENVILAFTQDGKLIFGFSVNETPESFELARILGEELVKKKFGEVYYFGVENIPALNEQEFLANLRSNQQNHD